MLRGHAEAVRLHLLDRILARDLLRAGELFRQVGGNCVAAGAAASPCADKPAAASGIGSRICGFSVVVTLISAAVLRKKQVISDAPSEEPQWPSRDPRP